MLSARSHLRRVCRDERGITIVEVMMVALLVTLAGFAMIDAMVSSGRLTHRSQRHEQAIAYAQARIEKIRSYAWSNVGLSSLPSHAETGNTSSTDHNPRNPDYYVNGSQFTVKQNWRDYTSTGGPGVENLVSGGTIPATESIPSSTGIEGTVHYYITQVPGLTATNAAGSVVGTLSGANQRRITVAIVLTGQPATGPVKPIWVTSTLANPQTCPLGLVLSQLPAGLTSC